MDSCPIGLFCKSGKCECGQYQYPQDITICNKHSLSILNYVCATFDEEKKMIQVGGCHLVLQELQSDQIPVEAFPGSIFSL